MPYDLFISYSRRDDERGQVTALKTQIESSFRAFGGGELQVFFDTHEIHGMDAWQQKIQRSLRTSQVFLAVLSPNYLASPYCRWEWEDYVRYEAMRQCLGEGVAPVFFITLPDATDPGTNEAIACWIDEIRRRQTFDLRPWHDAGEQALQCAHVRKTLEQLHASVRERLDRASRSRRSPNNLIKHNPAFVGRVRELTELRNALTRNTLGVIGAREGQAPWRATIQGLGGMGKTELALAYAHAFAWDYPGGRWQIPCEHIGDLRVALLHLANAQALNFEFAEDEKKNIALAFERVLRELNQRERCLLILDNVSDPNILQPEQLDRLPRDGHVDLIATTRLAPEAVPGSVQEQTFIAVDELPEEDALALMRSHQPEGRFASQQEDDEARAIARLLRGFTLAVETAGIYLGRHAAPDACSKFRKRLSPELLRESEIAATDAAVAVRHRVRSLEETLAFTLQTLTIQARHLLTFASLLPPDQVAAPWLKSLGMAKFPLFGAGPEPSGSLFRQTLGLLIGLRLLQTTEVTDTDGNPLVLRMHRLVQEVVKHSATEDISQLQRALSDFAVKRGESAIHVWADTEHQWEVEPLRATSMKWLADEIPEGAQLGSAISVPLYNLGRWMQCEQLMRLCIEVQGRLSGEDSLALAPLLNNLALVLRATNRLDEAEQSYRRAITIAEANLGENHPDLAAQLGNLADLLRDTDRLDEAETLIRKALSIDEAYLGPVHVDVAALLNNLATLFDLTGRLGEAEPLVRRALNIHESHYGANHPDVATDLANLATVLFRSNRLAEAEPLFRRALAIQDRVLDPEHPGIAVLLINIADLLRKTDRVAEAKTCIDRATAINAKHYGVDHPEVARALNSQAACLSADNRLSEAETVYRRSLAICESNFGLSHPHVATVLTNLASVLYGQGRLDEAIALLRRNLVILAQFSRSVGKDHPDLHRAMNAFGGVMEAAGWRKEEIMEQIRCALAEAP